MPLGDADSRCAHCRGGVSVVLFTSVSAFAATRGSVGLAGLIIASILDFSWRLELPNFEGACTYVPLMSGVISRELLLQIIMRAGEEGNGGGDIRFTQSGRH